MTATIAVKGEKQMITSMVEETAVVPAVVAAPAWQMHRRPVL